MILTQVLVFQGKRSRTNSPTAVKKPFIRLQAPESPPNPVGIRHGASLSNVRPLLFNVAPPLCLCHTDLKRKAHTLIHPRLRTAVIVGPM